MTAPITKVVKNEAYTAPRPPVPVAPTRPNANTAVPRSAGAAALQPVSRTLQQSTAETAAAAAPAPPQVVPPPRVSSCKSKCFFFYLDVGQLQTTIFVFYFDRSICKFSTKSHDIYCI